MAGELSDRAFADRTAGAPAVLRARAAEFAAAAVARGAARPWAAAGEAALDAAIAAGTGRAAALDLLAADALITLALLEAAREDPASLGAVARALRERAAAAAGGPGAP